MPETTFTLPEQRPGHEAPQDLVERRALVGGADDQQVIADGVTADETELGGVQCVVCAPASPARTLVYFHGGGYRLGTARGWRTFGSNLAAAASARVVLVNYSLAPEHPFPAAIRDAIAVYDAVVADGGVVYAGGDSAGGGLAAALTVACLQRGAPVPQGLVLISPWLDLTQTASTYDSRADTDIMFPKESADAASALYLQGHDPRDPLASPQFADVTGFPPTQLFAGGAETLLDDSLEFAARVARAGGAVELVVAPDEQHVYPYLAPDGDAGRAAHTAIVRFLTRA
jgi:monoterpene epsilon-lactone hydrolase